MKLEYGANIRKDSLVKNESKNQNIMNKNKSADQLAEEIWTEVNAPKKLSLKEDLKKNSFHLKQFSKNELTEELVLNQSVISDTSMTDGVSTVVVPVRSPGVSIPGLATSIVPYLRVMSIDKGSLSYVYQSGRTGSAGVRLENIIIPKQDREFTEKSMRATSIGGYMDATVESLEDAEFLSGEIEAGLRRDIELILSNQIINGDGVAPNVDGLLNQATAFNAGSFATSVTGPTYMDVLKVASNMILTAGYSTTLAICHPDDYTRMNLGNNAIQTANFTIVPTTQMTIDNYLIMDGNLVSLYLLDQKIKISEQNVDNAINNIVSIIGTLRAILKLSPNNTDGVIKGVFSTDLTAITAP